VAKEPVSKERRIYIVRHGDDEGGERLIRALTKTKARAFAASDIEVSIASQNDLVELLADGVDIEDAPESELSRKTVDVNTKPLFNEKEDEE
jgi:hypothetical protein